VTPNLVAMLVGSFGVPAVLLWAGHRLRRRPTRWRGAFWGAVVAHILVAPAVMVAAMFPAAEWAPNDVWRGALGFWALLLAPMLGAALGALRSRGE
jgi:hypothetical protein